MRPHYKIPLGIFATTALVVFSYEAWASHKKDIIENEEINPQFRTAGLRNNNDNVEELEFTEENEAEQGRAINFGIGIQPTNFVGGIVTNLLSSMSPVSPPNVNIGFSSSAPVKNRTKTTTKTRTRTEGSFDVADSSLHQVTSHLTRDSNIDNSRHRFSDFNDLGNDKSNNKETRKGGEEAAEKRRAQIMEEENFQEVLKRSKDTFIAEQEEQGIEAAIKASLQEEKERKARKYAAEAAEKRQLLTKKHGEKLELGLIASREDDELQVALSHSKKTFRKDQEKRKLAAQEQEESEIDVIEYDDVKTALKNSEETYKKDQEKRELAAQEKEELELVLEELDPVLLEALKFSEIEY